MVEIEKSTNIVYRDYFAKNELVNKWNNKGLIYNSYWRESPSENSFCLMEYKKDKDLIPKILEDTFGINDEVFFRKKYDEAVSGDGQEWRRICTLHSSSLIALLCFYSISENNPLRIDDYTFTESFFEVKTQVYEDSKSNMDIVLRGKNKKGDKVVLFLESKFSEYLDCGKCDNISELAYEKTYEMLGLFNNNPILNTKFENGSGKICIYPTNKSSIYCGGIKQMLSHFIGVSNYAKERENALIDHYRFKANKNEIVLLGEILFDFNENFSSKKIENYKNAYSSLAHRINEKQDFIKMMPEILTYQNIFIRTNTNTIKEENIRKFYSLI